MQGARLLLVEDDAMLCQLIMRNLRARGHLTTSATDVEQALHCLRTQTFDLIILDINLPDQTGWDVLRCALQERVLQPLPEGNHAGKLPVVVLSAVRVSPRRLAEFRPLAYLPKPFVMDALLRLAAEAASDRHYTSNSIPCRADEEA
ncbi:two-component system response regulator AtoC [Thermosporothrix hazakensis]|jgi:DNA-binding response OmpR family regulator|uniref:Two-component system response regulator AtoC n=2 Tax=Thermosporothrix TaxID=768650 RepID=A0A326UA06_THEHA|nr:response regulator [Thermosporothrix hazakensis]PZW31964.1 two-component system response regulator AtoC [Thermosporothrix hazakensis]BBH91565.1 hypothetical protein KTC_63160 [Thermosporothrix sp. COM3]GCE49711.1 hypothetical protein KTH_45800 [Thermosporothrix hazakensis]